MDSVQETLALAKLWDARGLLHIHDTDLMSFRRFELVRVFNCLKNEAVDRQIGDRRGRNAVEGRVTGPSSDLPTGPDLLDLALDPRHETLSIICTDRRDFYHQFRTTENRTLSNTVGPMLPLDALKDTAAFEAFAQTKKTKKPSRLFGGDRLGVSERQTLPLCPSGMGMISFKSIFQGDHAGVEIATSAHEGVLRSAGLLDDTSRVVASRPFLGDSLMEGLVIDDYFAIAKVPRGLLVPSPAEQCLAKSKDLYSRFELVGSDDKDITGERKAKIIGACLNASEQCQSRGHVLVSSPAEKRYALSWLSLQVAQLSHTSDSLHLCLLGGWTSILMYRRPLMSVLQHAFHLIDLDVFVDSQPKLVRLSRKVANELTLLAVLAPLAVSDIASGFANEIYATDASLDKGAIVSSLQDKTVVEVLWKSCRSKGGYSKMLDQTQSILARSIDFEELEVQRSETVRRPLAYRFDFIEVFAGAATVTAKMSARGFSVGCPIDISFDKELDASKLWVIEWLIYLISNRLVKAVMIEPPCTTFSIMRRPALRSRACPFGFSLDDPQTSIGTKLAMVGFLLLHVCWWHGVTAVLENPWTSKIKFLPPWQALKDKENVEVVRSDSCAFGSIHLKAFMFMCVWADTSPISRRCKGGHTHVHVQGSYTKESATYVDDLADALAQVMAHGIHRLLDFEAEATSGKYQGLESQLINELCLSSKWCLDDVWTFRVSAHINLLELSSVVRLVSRLVRQGKSLRVVILVDSNVIKCACAKGRSSSRALSKLLVRLAALSVVGGLYLVFGFVPTRHNVADDPTRNVSLRPPLPGMDLAAWDRSDLFKLAALQKCRRWASNWIRLTLSLLGSQCLDFSDRARFKCPRFPFGLCAPFSYCKPGVFDCLDFDSTLGFPGEGPSRFLACQCLAFRWILLVVVLDVVPCHGVLFPRNAGDIQRILQRNARPPLQEGRPVLGVTSKQRSSFLEQFGDWLRVQSISFDALMDSYLTRVEEINKLLVQYGRSLYAAGRPYNHYAETINAIAAKKPALRRQLQEAWNLAFSWVRDEPSAHHIAMPWQVLLACISVCLTWGWLDVAGMLALSWGAVLRVGEFLQAMRKDLLLPCDTNFTNNFALLSLKEPKTRFTAARHQSAKLDIPDLLQVTHLAFSRLQPHQRLWAKSGQTLRTRFKQVLAELGLEHVKLNNKSLDPGSLRPGGATWILQQTEDSEFTRRRGRWINLRVMEIYIQEVSSFQYLAAIPANSLQEVYQLCDFFPAALHGARNFWMANIPWNVWFLLWHRQVTR